MGSARATRRHSTGALCLVGTPIGNLGDLSPRAARALDEADVVLCEDTRTTARLLTATGIQTRLERCDAHVLRDGGGALVGRMLAGERLCLVSDAGMPVISDPGAELVDAALDAGVPVDVVPGPSALTCAVSASGLRAARFYFQGFLARKGSERARQLELASSFPEAVVIYESPRRVEATLADLAERCPERRVALCRELTKLHQEVLRGTPSELLARLAERRGEGRTLKGECVLVIEAMGRRRPESPSSLGLDVGFEELAGRLLSEGASPKEASARLASALGIPKGAAYDRYVAWRKTRIVSRDGTREEE